MPHVSKNYLNHPDAPIGQWACAPSSSLGPYASAPPSDTTSGPANYCGQCVSYVKTVSPTLPARTADWKKGAAVKDNKSIVAGTVIATFNDEGKYLGHAAIYVDQGAAGITAYDQWVTGRPKPIGSRILKWGAPKIVNNADSYYVVD